MKMIESLAIGKATSPRQQPQPQQPGLRGAIRRLARRLLLPIRRRGWDLLNLSAFAIALLTLLVLVYDCRPQIVISLGTFLDERRPMSMQFSALNSGKFSIRHIDLTCFINDVELTGNSRVNGGGFVKVAGGFNAQVLLPSEQVPFQCPFETSFDITTNHISVTYADISIRAYMELESVPYWSTHRDFRFVTKRRSDGTLAWLAAPNRP